MGNYYLVRRSILNLPKRRCFVIIGIVSVIRYFVSASEDSGQHPQAMGGVPGGELEAAPGHDLHEAGARSHQAAIRGSIPGLHPPLLKEIGFDISVLRSRRLRLV